MSRYTGPTTRINRRFGMAIFPANKAFERRTYPPGQHGPTFRRKVSDYGEGLLEKQKLRMLYCLTEKQFRNLFQKASKIRGNTSENLIELLERRLDAAVYRMKFVTTIFAARQFVSHGHVKVNGKKVTIPSFNLQDGDVIEVKEKSRDMPIVLEAISSTERDAPEYLSVDYDKMKGTFVKGPKPDEVPYPVVMEPNLVIEYYSR